MHIGELMMTSFKYIHPNVDDVSDDDLGPLEEDISDFPEDETYLSHVSIENKDGQITYIPIDFLLSVADAFKDQFIIEGSMRLH